jgi:hypothetical protein
MQFNGLCPWHGWLPDTPYPTPDDGDGRSQAACGPATLQVSSRQTKANRHYTTSNQLAFQGGAHCHCHRAIPEMIIGFQTGVLVANATPVALQESCNQPCNKLAIIYQQYLSVFSSKFTTQLARKLQLGVARLQGCNLQPATCKLQITSCNLQWRGHSPHQHTATVPPPPALALEH